MSLLPYRIGPFNEATAAATSNADFTIALLDHGANNIVGILGAVLDAPPGPVLIHCHAGKDRTGLIAALCLELAGLGRDEIAADYAATGPELLDFYARMKARKTPEQWTRQALFVPTTADDVLRPLAHLETVWGGVGAYLAACGFSEGEQAALAGRFMKG